MDLLASILLTLFAALGVLLAALLVMPLSASVEGAVDAETLQGRLLLRARWAFGLLGLDYAVGRGATLRLFGLPVARVASGGRSARKAASKPKRAKKPKTSKRPRRKRGARWAWGHRQILLRAALRLLGTLHIRGRVSGVVGLPEPDDTVWLGLALYRVAARLPAGTLDLDLD